MNQLQQVNGEDRGNTRLLRIILGAGSATLLLTSIFLAMEQSHSDSLRWMILPYLCVPAAGALAGLVFDMTQQMREGNDMEKVLGLVLSALAYAGLFAAAFVLGMNGADKIFL